MVKYIGLRFLKITSDPYKIDGAFQLSYKCSKYEIYTKMFDKYAFSTIGYPSKSEPTINFLNSLFED